VKIWIQEAEKMINQEDDFDLVAAIAHLKKGKDLQQSDTALFKNLQAKCAKKARDNATKEVPSDAFEMFEATETCEVLDQWREKGMMTPFDKYGYMTGRCDPAVARYWDTGYWGNVFYGYKLAMRDCLKGIDSIGYIEEQFQLVARSEMASFDNLQQRICR